MPTPPITIGELTNVPAPGSGVTSAWAQDVSERVVMRFANTAERDAAFPAMPGTGPLLLEPFDNFTTAPWAVSGFTIIAGGRTGNGAQSAGASSVTYTIPAVKENDTLTVGFAVKVSTLASSRPVLFLRSDASLIIHNCVSFETDGSIAVRRGNAGGIIIGQTAAGLVLANQFYYLELQIKLHDTTGTVVLRLDGIERLNLSGQDTKNLGSKAVYDSISLQGASSGTHVFDELYLAVGPGAFRGDIGVATPGSSATPGTVAYTAADDSYWGFGTTWTKLSGGSSSGIAVGSIIECAATPAGTAYELRWSSLHQAMMRWSGTQWVFASGPPPYYIADDMWGQSGNGNFTTTPLTVGGNTILSDSPPHYGINRATSGNATVSGFSYRGAGSITNLSAGAGLRMRCVFMLPNVAANTLQRIGFHDWSVPNTAPVDGAWLEIAAGVMSFKTSAAGVATTSALGGLGTGNWYIVHIWFPTATTARCIVTVETGALVLDVTNSTNIPTGANKFGVAAAAVFNLNVTGTILLDVDWIGWGYASI